MRNSIIRQKSYFCREIENMKSRFLRTLLLSVFVAAFCVNAVAKILCWSSMLDMEEKMSGRWATTQWKKM